ncbi:uncharacterized protein LODBEIA_P27130 [Lodderomyces beijingensis]|uniref:SPX domain-containing protein n=1 Tax=Lodderomyces beijingensis TaxID=1775926 RepID=A0ABP0ZK11_9ASCO
MKFSHSLKFNAVPEWQESYLNYVSLKKTIYKLEQDQAAAAEELGEDDREGRTRAETVTQLMEVLKNSKHHKNNSASSSSSFSSPPSPSSSSSTAKSHSAVSLVGSRLKKNRLAKTFFPHKFGLGGGRKDDLENSEVELQKFEIDYGNEKGQDVSTKSSEVRTYSGEIASSTSTSTVNLVDFFNDADAAKEPLDTDPLYIFAKLLTAELEKIKRFYNQKEAQVFDSFDNLIGNLAKNHINVEELFQERTRTREASNSQDQFHSEATTTPATTTTTTTVLDGTSVYKHFDQRLDDSKPINQYDLENQITVNTGSFDVGEDSDDDEDDDDDEEEEDSLHSKDDSVLLNHSYFNVKHQFKVAMKKKAVCLFINLSELKSYIELNKVAFTKICKKFDKICGYSIKEDFIKNVLPYNSRVFNPTTTDVIDCKINQVVKIYALFTNNLTMGSTTKQELEYVKNDLRSHLRDHIVFERNTVWKDLLSLEKRAYTLDLENSQSKMGDEGTVTNSLMYMRMKEIKLPKWASCGSGKAESGSFSLPELLFSKQMLKILITVVVFAILISVKTFNDPVQGRALAVLVACAMLWASEAIPLYTTALLVPLLAVTCQVCKIEGTDEPMAAADASKYVLSAMWNSTIMILIGGFTLAAALSKYNIAKVFSSYILAFAGTNPRNVLLAIMGVSLFLSMWISNVAAPVLCYSLINSVLHTLPTESPVAQALVLGIALSANIGGMASPISSPQNVIAFQYLQNPSWGNWFAVALPVSILSLVLVWVLLFTTFKMNGVRLSQYKPIKDRWTVKQCFVLLVTLATVILWCVMQKIGGTFGESGIISIIPLTVFYACGLLKVDDLNNYPMNIVFLASGGMALSKAITSSGLLSTIAIAQQKRVMDYDVYVVLIIFGCLALVVATFVSHTVSAILLLPIMQNVGKSLPDPHPALLVTGIALISSIAQALPSSGFPNITAISMRDDVGRHYLTVRTFLLRGAAASIICYLCIITLGYGIMKSLKF